MLNSKYFITSIIIAVLVLVGILSYHEEISNPTHVKVKPEPKIVVRVKNLDKEAIPEELLTLNKKLYTNIKQGDIKANLFGKFFYNRAEFYIIKNPQNKIYTSQTESITLFYLDGELCQTKYLLENNIASALLKDLGKVNIKGFDFKNRDIISSGNSIIREKNKGLTLNKSLDNYRLKWSFGDKEIIYRVYAVQDNKTFEYLEKRKDYEQEFKAVEMNVL